ncbi:MAG: sulfatase-like hydrolase/transferase, partial [Pirellulaceae bacterium]|nr:sulfatase-like hydrolase/transferase [Pirellulaceae bacterium]
IGETYAPSLMIGEAEKFINEHSDRPFFLYLPFIEPHVAMHPPQELFERFPLEWDTEVYRGEGGYLPHPRPRAAYAAMIHDLDRHVGRVLQALDKAGVAERTLVIFTSDNGSTLDVGNRSKFHVGGADPKFFNSTQDLRGYKGSVYEGGLRVPTIVRLPGAIVPGAANHSPSYFADWFPTLCDAASLATPEGLDGESLWRSLTKPHEQQTRQKPMVWVFPEYSGQVAVRFGDWKLVRSGLRTPQPGPWELYNMVADRSESTNLALEHPEVVLQGVEILRRENLENNLFPVVVP